MKLFRLVTGWASALLIAAMLPGAPGLPTLSWQCMAATSPVDWEQPASALAEQIAAILGPGQATFTIRNASSIVDADLPIIRALFEKDLKAHGITIAPGESANAIRVTLSQNDRERLWVAEIAEGNETRVAMVPAGPGAAPSSGIADYMTLRREKLPILKSASGAISREPILASFETTNTLVVLRPETVDLSTFAGGGWQQQKSFSLDEHRPLARDPRGIVLPASDGFMVFAGPAECTGIYVPRTMDQAQSSENWTIRCHASDEPWPLVRDIGPGNPFTLKAFYNAARNYFTGVITPSLGIDLPPFYSAALLMRPNGPAVLIGGVDGKVRIAENGALKPVSGARDWGSDFAVLNSGCGSGAQVIASGSGQASSDSLRAYELPGQEAVPASAPLTMNGTVTALWAAPDGKSLLAAVELASGDYEVDRVTALCN